ncbi:MAG TPA: YafY family protein, partial [Thermomicrobiales bacterium]|nr:YafY family protein [Thermomicrobiales bacterium]
MRVLTVLELLQARESVSGAELAERLEVSVRTVQRYVARLRDLGVPVESTRGPGGAYRLRPGFRLPPLMFGAEEAFALALGLDALTYLGLGKVAPAAAGARAKLDRVLPVPVGERVNALRAALLLDRPRSVVEADVSLLMELAAATHDRHRVRLSYATQNGAATERTVEPLGLMQHEGRWFLAANCLLREDLRLFRVDRIKTAEALAEAFEPPTGFDLRAFIYERIALAAARWEVEVWLELPPEALEPRLPRAMAVIVPDGTGSLMRCSATDLEDIAEMLLRVRCRIEVRSPAELVDAFHAVAR